MRQSGSWSSGPPVEASGERRAFRSMHSFASRRPKAVPAAEQWPATVSRRLNCSPLLQNLSTEGMYLKGDSGDRQLPIKGPRRALGSRRRASRFRPAPFAAVWKTTRLPGEKERLCLPKKRGQATDSGSERPHFSRRRPTGSYGRKRVFTQSPKSGSCLVTVQGKGPNSWGQTTRKRAGPRPVNGQRACRSGRSDSPLRLDRVLPSGTWKRLRSRPRPERTRPSVKTWRGLLRSGSSVHD